MLIEIFVFLGTILSNVLYLACRYFAKNKLTIGVRKFSTYQLLFSEDAMAEVNLDADRSTDFLRTG